MNHNRFSMFMSLNSLIVILVVSGCGCSQDVYNLGTRGKEYTLKIYRDTYVIIECGTNAIHVEELPRSVAAQISFLSIEYCQLPRESLQDVVEALGARSTPVLSLRHVPIIKPEHFTLGAIDKINIAYSGVASDAFEQQSLFKDVNLYKSTINWKGTSFSGLTKLERLSITECNITTIPQNIFQALPQLKELNLPTNLITEVTNSNFEGLLSLEVLELNENQLTTLPEDFLRFLPSLQSLFLTRNPLRELITDALRGSNLWVLIIKDNTVPLTLSPRALSDMTRLKLVDLKNCSITTLPADLLEGSNEVYTLDLSNNLIQYIPTNFFVNKNSLAKINLNHNRLSVLAPDTFAQLPTLRILDLTRNTFTGDLTFHAQAKVRLDIDERVERSARRAPRLARGAVSRSLRVHEHDGAAAAQSMQ